MSEPAEPAPAEPAPPPRFMSRWLVWALGIGLGGAAGWLVVSTVASGPVARIEGRIEGPVRRVYLVELERGVFHEARLGEDGRYAVSAPAAAERPEVVARGPEGASVRSGALALDGEGPVEVEELRLWLATLRVRRNDLALRFDWNPIPAGEPGYPEARLKYSLLVSYPKPDGERGEVALIAFDPWIEISLPELQEYMPDLDPERDAMELELRAYDSGDEEGPTWVGTRVAWRFGAEEVEPIPAPE